MPSATLTLTVPERTWVGAVSRGHPDAQFRVLAALPDEHDGVGLVELTAPDVDAILAEMRAHATVTDVSVLRRTDNGALLQFETTMPLLLGPLRESGIPLELPFTLQDGEARWEVTASRDRLAELGDQLDEFGIPFTVETVHPHVGPEHPLTDKQLRLVEAAVERGYYDTPRRCTLTELADELGMAKSTCSETLHRAEGTIVKRFLEGTRDPV